jgi:hypothetical protein
MWKNIAWRGRPQITIWRLRIACLITKATNTHLQYVILIAFPLQQWLQERASILLHTYIDCLVTETNCVYCAVRAEFCQTIHQCSVITFIRILLLLEAGTSLAIVKRNSAVPDDGGALDRVELRHCLLSLHWVKVKGEGNVKQYYAGGNHVQTNISSKANICSLQSQTVYIVREENLITRLGTGGLEFHYRTLVLKVQVL